MVSNSFQCSAPIQIVIATRHDDDAQVNITLAAMELKLPTKDWLVEDV